VIDYELLNKNDDVDILIIRMNIKVKDKRGGVTGGWLYGATTPGMTYGSWLRKSGQGHKNKLDLLFGGLLRLILSIRRFVR